MLPKNIYVIKFLALAINPITAVEPADSVDKRQSATLAKALQAFLADLRVLPFDALAAQRAGILRASLKRRE